MKRVKPVGEAEKRLPRLWWGCSGRLSLPTFAFTSTPVQRLQASLCGFCFTFTFASGSRELEGRGYCAPCQVFHGAPQFLHLI